MAEQRYRFTVTGTGNFPVDMLRYDAAFPDGPEDATAIAASFDRRGALRERTIRLRCPHPPTEGRWASFSWKVDQIQRY